jgi:pyrimidine operon attenuation protein/uracil phosphoribosyltransferase
MLELFDAHSLQLTLHRLACQVLERYPNPEDLHIVGIQPRGVPFAHRLMHIWRTLEPALASKPVGALDVTFHRDDYRRADHLHLPSVTDMPFSVEGRRVLLIDDVLYTGRTIRAALDALLSFGRPASVELLVLIDRHLHREIPIKADYVGRRVHTTDRQTVVVEWAGTHARDSARIQPFSRSTVTETAS